MQRILVGVDGSETSMRAVDFAATLSASHSAELHLITVLSEGAIHEPGLLEYARVEHLRTPGVQLPLAAADDILRRAESRAAAAGVRRTVTEVGVGDPATGIILAAGDQPTDLVVVGSRGCGRLAGLLLGSVAQKLVGLAPCAVLVVR